MSDTDFLSTLHPERDCPRRANELAAQFMRTKGYPDEKPLGVYIDDALFYYYYRLPEGVLEVEVGKADDEHWTRRVSDFITSEEEVREMLGDEHPEPAGPSDAPMPLFKSPSV